MLQPSARAFTLLRCRGGCALRARVDPDGLGVDELADAEDGELAAVARVLHAAERDLGGGLGHPVYVDHSGLYLVHEAPLLVGVVGPRAGAEPEGGVVGDGYRLVDVPRAEERGYGTEDLLYVSRRTFRDVCDDRRRVEVAGTLHRLAAREHARAGLDALPDLRVHVLEDVRGGERPHVRVLVHRIADPQGLHALDVAALELVSYLLVDDDPLGVDARLAVVERPRGDGHVDGFIQIGARHHYERVAAAELEHGLLYVLPCLA